MSKQLPEDATHPDNMDDEARAALMAELDDEDAELGGDAAGESDNNADGDGKEGHEEGDGEEGDGNAEGAADAGAAPDASAEDDAKPVDAKAFKGVLKALQDTREELKALKASQHSSVAAPDDRDFTAERAALKDKWNDGDLDTDGYNDARDALVLEEAEHRAATRFHSMQQKAATEAATSQWQTKVTAWEKDNEAFLANPIRRKAAADLLAELEASGEKLSDDELLAKVQETSFEAFNWQGAPASGDTGAVNQRDVATARAASAASASPPALGGRGGMGTRAVDVDLERLKPGQFKDLPKDVQAALLEED